MKPMETVKHRVRKLERRILLAETHDDRVMQAAARIQQEGFCRIVLAGAPADLAERIKTFGVDPDRCDVLDRTDAKRLQAFAAEYLDLRKHKGMTAERAAETVRDPIFFGAMCLRTGLVDGMVAGSASPTPHVVRAALQCVGTREGLKTLSSFFLVILPKPGFGQEGVLLFSDCGVVPEPTTYQLVDIGRSAAASWRQLLGTKPILAFLSFSTKGSAGHPAARMMAEAARRVCEIEPDLVADGELQVDAALVPEVAAAKCPGSPVAGRANCLVFPNLTAGNIGYKLVERLGGAQAIGPLLQGLAKPINDLSRGCQVRDIVDAAAVTAAQTLAD